MTTKTEIKEVPCPGKEGFCNQTVDTGEELCWHCELEGSHPEGTSDGDDWGR